MNSLTVAVPALVILAVLGGLIALIRLHRPLLALPAGIAVATALATAFFFGPHLVSGNSATVVDHAPANFKSWYDLNALLYGGPVSEMTSENGLLVQYHIYVRQEYHEEIADPAWRYQLGNIGMDWLEINHINPDANPVTPNIIGAYLAGQVAKGEDIGRTFGHQIGNPKSEDGATVVFFQKAALRYPSDGSNDPATVTRLPLGQMVWEARHGNNIADPLTPTRVALLTIAAILAAFPFLASLILRLRGEGRFE